jgi:hypothetical protein
VPFFRGHRGQPLPSAALRRARARTSEDDGEFAEICFKALIHLALVADRAKMLVDAKHVRMNSAAMRENTIPTNTPAIEDNSRMKPANGLIAIAARPEKIPETPKSPINARTSQ